MFNKRRKMESLEGKVQYKEQIQVSTVDGPDE
jgi:hypothetical protein